MSDSWSDVSPREAARRLLAAPHTSSAPDAAPVPAAPSRRHAGKPFADHPDIVATRERGARARAMFELAGMPSPLFLQRRGPNNPVIDVPNGLTGL